MPEERPPELDTIFDELARRGPYASPADMNRALETLTRQYNDARMMLDYVATHGPLKETPAHNLSRSAVADLRPRLRLLRWPHSACWRLERFRAPSPSGGWRSQSIA